MLIQSIYVITYNIHMYTQPQAFSWHMTGWDASAVMDIDLDVCVSEHREQNEAAVRSLCMEAA